MNDKPMPGNDAVQNHRIMNDTVQNTTPPENPQKARTVKWMNHLLRWSVLHILLSVIAAVSADSSPAQVFRLFGILLVVCLFQLAPANPRYRLAGIFRLVAVVLSSASASILAIPTAVCSLLASYHEFYTHAEMVQALDSGLSRSWKRLLPADVIVSAGASVFLTVTLVLAATFDAPAGIIRVFIAASQLIPLVIDGFYVYYLDKTLMLLNK